MNTLSQRFYTTQSKIRHAEMASGRVKGSVQLLAVSKTKPAADIAQLYRLGQRHFGENYLQEALQKQQQLGCYAMTWHFIGPIQSNKCKAIAEHFNWVHSVERLKIARRLNDNRPEHLPPLNICLQINISDEASKSGILLAQMPDLVAEINALKRLRLRGVMAIPAPETDFEQQCLPYRELYTAVKALNKPQLDTFSYGMSGDLKAAIAEGATLVRIGTALFGKRA